MIAEGLLWFDDDPRRPFSEKVAEAARRFSERTGWAPTACEAHPQTLAQRSAPATAARGSGRTSRGKAAPVAEKVDSMPHLHVTANPSLRPNYILVGVEAGKTPRRARQERPVRSTTASARGRASRASSAARVSA